MAEEVQGEQQTAEEKVERPPNPLALLLQEKFGERVKDVTAEKGYPQARVEAGDLLEVARQLRDDPDLKFSYLRCIAGVDREMHFEATYTFLSMANHYQAVLIVRADHEAPVLPSLTPLWATANWQERETYDLLGIRFEGHPDLRRILLPPEWQGHPLRKDYVYVAED